MKNPSPGGKNAQKCQFTVFNACPKNWGFTFVIFKIVIFFIFVQIGLRPIGDLEPLFKNF